MLSKDGFAEYILNCTVSEDGFTEDVTFEEFRVARNPTPPQANRTEIRVPVTMEIHIKDDTQKLSEDVQGIGTPLELWFTSSYPVTVVNCTANPPSGSDSAVLYANGKSKNSHIFNDVEDTENINGTNGEDHLTIANIYSFRFASSDIVHISCRVKICGLKPCVVSTPARKRRAADKLSGSKEYTLQASFTVIDSTSGQGHVKFSPVAVVLGMAVAVLSVVGQERM